MYLFINLYFIHKLGIVDKMMMIIILMLKIMIVFGLKLMKKMINKRMRMMIVLVVLMMLMIVDGEKKNLQCSWSVLFTKTLPVCNNSFNYSDEYNINADANNSTPITPIPNTINAIIMAGHCLSCRAPHMTTNNLEGSRQQRMAQNIS